MIGQAGGPLIGEAGGPLIGQAGGPSIGQAGGPSIARVGVMFSFQILQDDNSPFLIVIPPVLKVTKPIA